MREKGGYIYILTNKPRGTLYIGVTSSLDRRLHEHKSRMKGSFTARYNLDLLVYFEEFPCIEDAIEREKQLKNWRRDWKVALIEGHNPQWRNLWSANAAD